MPMKRVRTGCLGNGCQQLRRADIAAHSINSTYLLSTSSLYQKNINLMRVDGDDEMDGCFIHCTQAVQAVNMTGWFPDSGTTGIKYVIVKRYVNYNCSAGHCLS